MLRVRKGSRQVKPSSVHRHILNRSDAPVAVRYHRSEATESNESVIFAICASSAERHAEYWRDLVLLVHGCEERIVGSCGALALDS